MPNRSLIQIISSTCAFYCSPGHPAYRSQNDPQKYLDLINKIVHNQDLTNADMRLIEHCFAISGYDSDDDSAE